MVRAGERFYTSLGFAPLPPTFWERSLFVRPRDREVVCHASAWDIDLEADVRIKMCIQPTEEDFTTIHHELGHNFYQRAYKDLPVIFRDSANDGFHEAIGDTIALSVTPEYLVRIGLLDKAPDASRDIGLLMSACAREGRVPAVRPADRPVALAGVLGPGRSRPTTTRRGGRCGSSTRASRRRSPRGEEFFDPGAKYHVPDNTPYTRYFLAHILQFQFHRALSKTAGCDDAAAPLLGLREQGGRAAPERDARRWACRSPGRTRSRRSTGSRQMDASAIIDYFAPLKTWLDEQLKGQKTGW